MEVKKCNWGYVTQGLVEVYNGRFNIITQPRYSPLGFEIALKRGSYFIWAEIYCEVGEIHSRYQLLKKRGIPTFLEDLPFLQEQSAYNLTNGKEGVEREGHQEVMKRYQ